MNKTMFKVTAIILGWIVSMAILIRRIDHVYERIANRKQWYWIDQETGKTHYF